ncbi:CPBP family intramembrane metalloprotease [Clostridium felsineum]|uniref:CPBP family intramembrane glutamic endopeptidase n=1 Tax=Clostridium felsineum TaxID=36839 RepID=UPI00214DBC37|nr:type II CAAX endopeptidase family protein [Clostridium felsineum]MCR3758260.1 CPBP family intramembrane metalloprotease [Clostridium felsineum]
MKQLKRDEIITFLIFTFVGTYLCWGILALSSRGILNKSLYYNNSLYTFLRILGASMPSIVGIMLSYYFRGKAGVNYLFKSLMKWKFNVLFYLVAMFSVNAQSFIIGVIYNVLGGNTKVIINTSQAYLFKTNSIIGVIGLFVLIVLFGGPVEEELGWRGFLLPRLQSKFHPILSGIIVGVIWAFWHLPMFFIKGSGYEGFISYLIVTIILSLEITWLYNKTKGSLLIAILLHGFDDTYAVIFRFSLNRVSNVVWIGIIFIAIIVVIDMLKKPLNKVVLNDI